MNKYSAHFFIILALTAFWLGLLFGCIAAMEYVFPMEVSKWIPFQKLRPVHVSLVISWILLSATGGIYFYLPQISGRRLFSTSLVSIHFSLFFVTGILILFCYSFGIFGGREYFEFPYLLAAPIFLGWILFAFNFFKSISFDLKKMPVYSWMWATGIVLMIYTLAEAYLWLIPFFRNNIIRDIVVQWKAYGSVIGSWNMLTYGTASFLMCRISNDETKAHLPLTFSLYYLGLINSFFNWGHHIYIVPAEPWIKHISYFISMTELLILGKIILDWKKTLQPDRKKIHLIPYRFLLAAEWWIFLNLLLAILISIPAINIFTHGTHVTVAHAMGTTIGINSMILLASVFYIFADKINSRNARQINFGFVVTNASLLVFWIALITAGMIKGYDSLFTDLTFQQVMASIRSYFMVVMIAGGFIFLGFSFVTLPLLLKLIKTSILFPAKKFMPFYKSVRFKRNSSSNNYFK